MTPSVEWALLRSLPPPTPKLSDLGDGHDQPKHPQRAILRAVAAGGAEFPLGTEPDLFLDGRCCCDQSAAHHLVHACLIAAQTLKPIGQRVVAALTPAGEQTLGIPAFAA